MAQVSVIIPTRNRGVFLGAALKSVLAQGYGDFEVVVVDDGGAPGSVASVESCADPRVRLLRHSERRGGAAARNSGIAATQAPYVAFLDDDDEWYPDKLERQVALIQSQPEPLGAIYTGYDIVEQGRKVGQIIPCQSGRLALSLLAGNLIGSTSSVLVRRCALDAIGGFDERLASFQDYDLWLRLARDWQFDFIAAPLLKYRVHGRKIWTDPLAIAAGLEVMLEKYGSHRAFRKKASRYYLKLGVEFCRAEERARGLTALRKAVKLDRYHWRARVYWIAAALARRQFGRLLAAKEQAQRGRLWALASDGSARAR